MNIFALSDLHLSLNRPFDPADPSLYEGTKPMGIFGDRWQDHIYRIYREWNSLVGAEDLVLIAGDISWAMTLEEARFDLDFIGSLPGRKIMIRGNHDYWWHSVKKIREQLPPNIEIIQNDAVLLEDIAICGTRLWTLPTSPDFKANDDAIYRRELIRAELSLKAARGLPVIFMSHFMPLGEKGEPNEVSELFEKYHVKRAIYGHLHDKSHAIAVQGERHGVIYSLTSADFLECRPQRIEI